MNAKKNTKQITNILIFLSLISCSIAVQAIKSNEQTSPTPLTIYRLKTATLLTEKFLEQTTKDDLWIFDIDDTIVEATDLPDQDRFMTTATKANHTKLMKFVKGLAREARNKFWESFYENYAYQPVEQRLIEIITSLQKRGIRVIALTARATEQHKATYNLLKKYVELDFSSSFVNNYFELKSSEGATFYNGILFTDYTNTKGELLTEFLLKIKDEENFDPSRIYFFDNQYNNVVSVVQSMNSLKKNCLGFHYTAAKDKERPTQELSINNDIVEYQYTLMKKWATYVSYQEAAELYSTLEYVIQSVSEKDNPLQED